MKGRKKLGFTLIELLVVIGILGTITAVAAPNVLGTKDTAEEEACRDQMDFILQGFQNEQLYPESAYAFTEVENGTANDGVSQLTKYIAKAIDPGLISEIAFEDAAVCPSGDTRFEAQVGDDGRLYVYCPVHNTRSHIGLRGRAPKVDPTVYDTGDGWTGVDDNWIVGDHESLLTFPLQSEYYHFELNIRLVKYDDGVDPDEGPPASDDDPNYPDSPDVEEKNPLYEYRYDNPDYFWPINTTFYAVQVINADPGENADNGFDEERPKGYDLSSYNPTNEELFFGLIIDYQDHTGVSNFTANSLEVKNVISNANLTMELDLVERDKFNSKESSHATHERDLMDEIGDWFIIDVLEAEPVDGKSVKRMVIHMQQTPKNSNDSHFKVIFDELVPVADPNDRVNFGFFMGKRDVETATKVGRYYLESYPTPVQASIGERAIDYGADYSSWFASEYKGFDGESSLTIPDLDS